MSANNDNVTFKTSDLARVRRTTCQHGLSSAKNGDPAAYADREWVVAPYLLPSGKVYGLIHDEFWGATHFDECKARLNGQRPWSPICLFINLTGSVSTDGATTFQPLAGDQRIVAAVPNRFATDMKRIGVEDPTNIIRNPSDGYLYFAANIHTYPQPGRGACLFRTKDPLAQPWMAWDGTGFNLRMSSPYATDPAKLAWCKPVSGLFFTSILFNQPTKQFVALGFETPLGGVFYRTSPDLIHWSAPVQLLAANLMNDWHIGMTRPVLYPSLVDPSSSSPNFDTMGRCAYLYYASPRTSFAKMLPRQRDIMRQRVCMPS